MDTDVKNGLIQLKDKLENEAGQANELYRCLILAEYGIEYMDGDGRETEAAALQAFSRLAGILAGQLKENVEFVTLLIKQVEKTV